jgi:hypothetical protein
MDEDENTFPMDFYVRDSSPHPWKFKPEGYLVVILSDVDEAQRAEADLVSDGVAPRDIKLYTGKQILENYEVFAGRRTTADKVIGSVVADSEGRELYLGYARQDRCAMWVRIPNEEDVPKALRVLADHDYVHARYYGSERQDDFNVS